NLEDWIFPSHARPFQPLDHFIRRLRLSIEQVLDLRDEGKLDEAVVGENLDRLRRQAEAGANPLQDTAGSDLIASEKNAQHGIPDVPQGRQDELHVHNWFGKFRLNIDEEGGGDERAEDVVAFFQPHTKLLLGACRLVDIFPDGRHPFVVSRGILDVNRWEGIGLAELLEPINQELDAFHKLAVSAGEGAIGPVVFFSPAAGLNFDKFRMEPYTGVPTADPNGIKVVQLGNINLAPHVLFSQQLMGFGERLTGLTDAQLGRQFERPNAPRTFGQQQLLQGESNNRLLLDVRLERESLREIVQRMWELDKRWLPKPFFFRVTEQDAGDVLTDEDMMGDYDFDIGPTTAISNRFQRMQDTLQALALLQASNVPPAYYALLKKVVQKLGHPDVAEFIPDLEAMKPPDSPQQENVRMLQGEDVDPHPMDNHVQHMAVHQDLRTRLEQTEKATPGFLVAVGGTDVLGRIDAHIAEHKQALKSGATLGGGQPGGGAPSQPASALGNLGQATQPGQAAQQNQGMLAGLLNTGNINLA
ncbi:MAG: portal protein, partial [Pyrinomonadaceae bacterium]